MSGLIQDAEAALDRRLDTLSHAPITLALSGGGDSLALLHLTSRWARQRGRPLLALTVDHDLHPNSGAWTAFAGAAAKAVGADWRALHWGGGKPATGLPAAARAARHRLLADAARDAGAEVILFGHTADDAAEGEIMRAVDAPGLGHLREWSPSPVWPQGRGVFILRPLLDTRRSTLRDWLQAQGAAWLNDPANEDLRFARARARAVLASSEPPLEGLVRRRVGLGVANLAAKAEHRPDGCIVVPIDAFVDADRSASLRFISICVVCASGGSSPPRTQALERLWIRMTQRTPFTASLGGARIMLAGGIATFLREGGGIRRSGLKPLKIRAGHTAIWDGRFEMQAAADLEITPLAGLAARLSKRDRQHMAELPAAIRPTMPAIFYQGEVFLPRPFGAGPASARALAAARFAAACGLVAHERDISRSRVEWGMAQGGRSSYVEALALA